MNATVSTRDDCLSAYALDRLLARELEVADEDAARGHVAGCARCAGRLAAFAAVAPPPLAAVSSSVRPPPRRLRPSLYAYAAGLALAASVAGVFAVGPWLRERSDVRAKGTLTLGGWLRHGSGAVVRLTPGIAVAPGEALRFETAGMRDGFIAILGLDAAGHVTRYLPTSGPLPPLKKGPPSVMPGSIVADGTLGAERIVALLCAEPVAPERLEAAAAAALARAGGAPERVGALDIPCEQTALLIDKRSP